MKVYVFTHHTAIDCEFIDIQNEVFKKREDALAAFEEWKDDEMSYVTDAEWDIGTDEEGHFEAYENGCYCTNHTEGFVNEYEVE